MVRHTGNTTGVSPSRGCKPRIGNGKSGVLRLPFSRPPCVKQEDPSPTNLRSNDVLKVWSRIVRKICNPGKYVPEEKIGHGDWVERFILTFRFCTSNRLHNKVNNC